MGPCIFFFWKELQGLMISSQSWKPLKFINKYFVCLYMHLQNWISFYEIGRINTGEITSQKIFIISFHFFYLWQLLSYCLSASNLRFHTLLCNVKTEILQNMFSPLPAGSCPVPPVVGRGCTTGIPEAWRQKIFLFLPAFAMQHFFT